LFDTADVLFRDFRGEAKEYPGGLTNICAKVLCNTHNSALSALDAHIAALKALGDYWETGEATDIELDGLLFTRWCMKYVAGFVAAGWSPLGRIASPIENVRMILGLDHPIDGHLGIYGPRVLTRTTDITHVVGLCELVASHDSGARAVFGATITIHHFTFLLWLSPHPIPRTFFRDGMSIGLVDTSPESLVFRPSHYNFRKESAEAQLRLRIIWPENIPKHVPATIA
jgi:hypothetical protein